MGSSLFISYDAVSDSAFAHQLARDLVAFGQAIWMAPDSIKAGESFPSAIDRGLESASVFLLVVTPGALGSPWVKSEVDAAIDLEKKKRLKIIPIVLKETALPPLLSSYQTLQITGDYEASFRNLLEAIGIAYKPGSVAKPVMQSADDFSASAEAKTPLDSYAKSVFQALQFGTKHYDYLIHSAVSQESSITLAIAERELLRVGLVVFKNEKKNEEFILSKLKEELAHNPHQVIGLIGIQPGEPASMKFYQFVKDGETSVLQLYTEDTANGSEPPQILHLRWSAIDGDHAVAQALDMFFKYLRKRENLQRFTTDSYVEAALSAMRQSAQFLEIDAVPPEPNSRSILRLLLDPEGFRIGVAIWTSDHDDSNEILADMSGELHSNPHKINGLIGIYASKNTQLRPFDLLKPGKIDSFIFAWNPKSGADAFRGALQQIWAEMDRDPGAGPDPFAAAFHFGRADAFLEAGLLEDAVLEADEAIRIDPDLSEAHLVRADALLGMNRPEAALAAADKALNIDPDSADCHAIRAESLLALGRASDGLKAAKQSVRCDPQFAIGHCILSDALLQLDQNAEALAAVEEAIRLDVQDPHSHTTKATVLLKIGKTRQAVKSAKTALALDPDDINARSVKEQAISILKKNQR